MRLHIYLLVTIWSALISITLGDNRSNTEELSLTPVYTNYTTKDGLPSNETYCVFQDSRGYIWIGTDRGLVRYDGYEFKVYTTLDGLTDNVILAINEDNKGNIWYTGLNNHQLGYIDTLMELHTYEHYDELKQILENIEHPRIYFNEIHIEDSSIYMVNNRMGYVKFNTKELIEVSIKNIEFDFKIGTHMFFNGQTQFIYSDPCYNNRGTVFTRVFNNDTLFTSYTKKSCTSVNPTWLRSESGNYIYDDEDLIILNEESSEHVKLNYRCLAFEVPEIGYIYTTFNSDRSRAYISDSPYINDPKSKLLDNVIICSVLKDKNGRLWVGTRKHGVFYFPDLVSKKMNGDFQIEAILPLKDELLLRVSDDITIKYNLESEKVEKFSKPISYSQLENTSPYFNFFGKVVMVDSSRIMLDSLASGNLRVKGGQFLSDSLFYIFSVNNFVEVKNGKTINHYRNVRNKGGHRFSFPKIQTTFCKEERDCYIGTAEGIYHYTDSNLNYLDIDRGKSIRDIHYNREIKAWIYAILGEGLTIRYDDGRLIRLSDKEGLASNFINQSFVDSNGVIWLATNHGINTCQITDNDVKIETVFSSSKLLNSPNILQLYAKDSVLYLGTDAGFNSVDLKSLVKHTELYTPLILDAIYVGDLKMQLPFKSLDYDQNNITIFYTALSYNQFGNIEYRYRLKGLSDQWIYTKERKAIFNGIASGDYSFELEVKNEFGNWSTLEKELKFNILKPYWKTWWFRVLILGMIGSIIYYYISNLKREKNLLEDKQKLSEELNESQQKALSSQLNPHFVFNSLNSIQNFILTRRTELSSDYLSMFSKLMRFIFENSKKLYVPLIDEIEALRLYLELEQVRHNHKFNYEIDSNTIQPTKYVIPSLLIQPMIENAIWHGLLHKKSGHRMLEIAFKTDDTNLHIEIKDNGVGRGHSKPRHKFIKKQRSSGVELTKQRLRLLSESTGLKTNFEIVDLFDDSGKPNGTLVNVSIPVNLK